MEKPIKHYYLSHPEILLNNIAMGLEMQNILGIIHRGEGIERIEQYCEERLQMATDAALLVKELSDEAEAVANNECNGNLCNNLDLYDPNKYPKMSFCSKCGKYHGHK